MTAFLKHPGGNGLVKLSGTIANYTQTRQSASFFFTESDRTRMGVIAIAAAFADLGAQASAMASNATALEEEADHVQFTLDGEPVQGWLWRSPFGDGDVVDVAAQWQGERYEAFGVARPADKMIALYPHCSRSQTRHVKNAVKWWLIFSIVFQIGMMLTMWSTSNWNEVKNFWSEAPGNGSAWFVGGLTLFFGIACASMTRQWMPFVRVAEKVFKTLGLPHPGNIDLVKSSRTQRTEQDKAEFGSMYFRY